MSATVYAITNTANGKTYVGCTAKTIEERFHQHILLLRRNKHKNIGMQNDYNKYGEGAFTLRRLGDCPPHGWNELSEEKLWMERLKTYDSRYGYNDRETASTTLRKRANEA